MRGYQDFLKDTDGYIAKMKNSMASVLDDVAGLVSNARDRCNKQNLLRLQSTGATLGPAGKPAGSASDGHISSYHYYLLNYPVNQILKTIAISAKRVGFFNIGSGRVRYWTKYRVAGRVRVG